LSHRQETPRFSPHSSGSNLQQVKLSEAPCKWKTEHQQCGTSIQTTAASGSSVTTDAASASDSSFSCPSSARQHLTAGVHTLQGHKACMPGCPNQDAHLIVQITPNLMLAAIFDGHGRHGHHTSARVRGVFEQQARFLAAARSSEDLVESLRNIFLWLQKALEQEGLAHYSGTTATVALIDSVANVVTVAHVGDSSLAVVKGATADGRTTDHVVDEVAERRILAHGGEVTVSKVSNTNTRRICAKGSKFPGLAMARSLGDQEAQRLGASFEPEFTFLPLQAGSSVVVASDGVWDMLDPAAAASYLAGASAAQPERGASDLARMLVAEARSRYALGGDVDDITAIVVQAAPQLLAPESRDRTRSH